MNTKFLAFGCLLLGGLAYKGGEQLIQEMLPRFRQSVAVEPTAEEKEKILEQETQRLYEHVLKSIKISNAKLTLSKTGKIAEVLTKVGMESLDNFEQRELWIAVIANESRFDDKARSHKGAVGLGQVMPNSAKFYGEKCNLPKISDKELYNIETNAKVSACIFKIILQATGGSPALALTAYNAGQWSKDIQNLDKLVSINKESANYIAKIGRFLEKTREVSLLSKE